MVGLDGPPRADVPAGYHPVRRVVGQDARQRHLLPSVARSTKQPPTRGSNTVSATGAPSRLCSVGLKSPNLSVNTVKARSIGASPPQRPPPGSPAVRPPASRQPAGRRPVGRRS